MEGGRPEGTTTFGGRRSFPCRHGCPCVCRLPWALIRLRNCQRLAWECGWPVRQLVALVLPMTLVVVELCSRSRQNRISPCSTSDRCCSVHVAQRTSMRTRNLAFPVYHQDDHLVLPLPDSEPMQLTRHPNPSPGRRPPSPYMHSATNKSPLLSAPFHHPSRMPTPNSRDHPNALPRAHPTNTAAVPHRWG